MNPAVLLSLIADLYGQLLAANTRIEELEARAEQSDDTTWMPRAGSEAPGRRSEP